MTINAALTLIWFAIPLATLLIVIPIVIWGIKTRQFSDQDRVRYLPLSSPGPERKDGSANDVLP